jgi:hypothetical protein
VGASVTAFCLLAAACSGRSVSDPIPNEQHGTAGRGGHGATGGAGGGSGAVGPTGGTGGFCFEAGSRVATPRGSVPIEDLRLGDEVLAFDERTGAIAARRVVTTHVHETTRTGVLTLRDGRSLRVTPEHPIFDAGTQRFEPAGSIRPGDEVVTLSVSLGSSGVRSLETTPSLLAPVKAYEPRELDAPVRVYNLSVEDFETYFVEGVLVHNKSTGGSAGFGGYGGYGGVAGHTAGVSGGGGTAGACERVDFEAVLDEPCAELLPCLDPLAPRNDFVTRNRAVGIPESDGAGGEAGAEGEGGSAGQDEVIGVTQGLARVCNPLAGGYAPEASFFLAFDVFQPSSGSATHAIVGSYEGCSGIAIGNVVLTDFDAPPPGSWTTQCARLMGSEFASGIILATEATARVANPRFVAGCECARELKRYTTCGYDPNGQGRGSACE